MDRHQYGLFDQAEPEPNPSPPGQATSGQAKRVSLEQRQADESRSVREEAPISQAADTQESPDSNNDVPVLRRAAMDVLARREHSRFELRQKLQHKYPDTKPHLIDQVLAQLEAENLLSDARFVDSYVRYRKSRGFGYLHISADLSERRVAGALIEQYLFVDDEDWVTIAEDLVARKLGANESLEFASKAHRRLQRFLESRGFTSAHIRRVLEPRLVSSGNRDWD